MATLRIFRGPELLVEHRLRPGRTIIGRADTCDIALPGDAISRTHCIIEGNKTDWRATDRSRHGTLLNEQILTDTKPIVDGSVLSVGPFLIEVSLTASPPPATAVQNVDHDHELLIDTEDQLHVERAVLVVHLDNPETIRFPLNRPRLGVGGPNSNIHVAGLVDDHFWLRITRGRVMIEPGRGAVFLEGQRLRTITPLYADEEFQAGLIRFRVDRTIFEESPKASGFGDMVGESEKITLLFGILRRGHVALYIALTH